jgi:hypothetical protein
VRRVFETERVCSSIQQADRIEKTGWNGSPSFILFSRRMFSARFPGIGRLLVPAHEKSLLWQAAGLSPAMHTAGINPAARHRSRFGLAVYQDKEVLHVFLSVVVVGRTVRLVECGRDFLGPIQGQPG